DGPRCRPRLEVVDLWESLGCLAFGGGTKGTTGPRISKVVTFVLPWYGLAGRPGHSQQLVQVHLQWKPRMRPMVCARTIAPLPHPLFHRSPIAMGRVSGKTYALFERHEMRQGEQCED